ARPRPPAPAPPPGPARPVVGPPSEGAQPIAKGSSRSGAISRPSEPAKRTKKRREDRERPCRARGRKASMKTSGKDPELTRTVGPGIAGIRRLHSQTELPC